MSHRPDLGFYDEGHDLAAPAFFASATLPEGECRVLPAAAYRSLAFTLLEDEAIWSRDWICVGSHEAVPAVGDLLPFTIGTHGVHVQRVEDGVAARFNKAQHGGCRMVPLQCQTGAKTKCSFTSCGYSRDRPAIPASALGDGTPEMHQYLGLRPERLLAPHLRSWGPLIFVNLDVSPSWPEQEFGSLNRLGSFFGNEKPRRSTEIWLEFQSNWKLLGQRLAGGAVAQLGDDWAVTETTLAGGDRAVAAWLFPNLVLLSSEHETLVAVLQHTAIGQTLCRISVYGENPDDGLDRWRGEIESRAAEAVQDTLSLARWGTNHRPETIGEPMPLQNDPLGAWMQRRVASGVSRAPRGPIEQPLFQNPRH